MPDIKGEIREIVKAVGQKFVFYMSDEANRPKNIPEELKRLNDIADVATDQLLAIWEKEIKDMREGYSQFEKDIKREMRGAINVNDWAIIQRYRNTLEKLLSLVIELNAPDNCIIETEMKEIIEKSLNIKDFPDSFKSKQQAIYEAIKTTDVGSDVIINNTDGSVWCIAKIIAREEEH